jgi:hypothetical protein
MVHEGRSAGGVEEFSGQAEASEAVPSPRDDSHGARIPAARDPSDRKEVLRDEPAE